MLNHNTAVSGGGSDASQQKHLPTPAGVPAGPAPPHDRPLRKSGCPLSLLAWHLPTSEPLPHYEEQLPKEDAESLMGSLVHAFIQQLRTAHLLCAAPEGDHGSYRSTDPALMEPAVRWETQTLINNNMCALCSTKGRRECPLLPLAVWLSGWSIHLWIKGSRVLVQLRS